MTLAVQTISPEASVSRLVLVEELLEAKAVYEVTTLFASVLSTPKTMIAVNRIQPSEIWHGVRASGSAAGPREKGHGACNEPLFLWLYVSF